MELIGETAIPFNSGQSVLRECMHAVFSIFPCPPSRSGIEKVSKLKFGDWINKDCFDPDYGLTPRFSM